MNTNNSAPLLLTDSCEGRCGDSEFRKYSLERVVVQSNLLKGEREDFFLLERRKKFLLTYSGSFL